MKGARRGPHQTRLRRHALGGRSCRCCFFLAGLCWEHAATSQPALPRITHTARSQHRCSLLAEPIAPDKQLGILVAVQLVAARVVAVRRAPSAHAPRRRTHPFWHAYASSPSATALPTAAGMLRFATPVARPTAMPPNTAFHSSSWPRTVLCRATNASAEGRTRLRMRTRALTAMQLPTAYVVASAAISPCMCARRAVSSIAPACPIRNCAPRARQACWRSPAPTHPLRKRSSASIRSQVCRTTACAALFGASRHALSTAPHSVPTPAPMACGRRCL